MKKYLIYSLLLGFVLSFSSCLFQEDDIFDDSAAQRMNKVLADAKETLISSENGWIMLYFPNNESMGYYYFMKFHNNGTAEVGTVIPSLNKIEAVKNYAVYTGGWDMVADNGPVLSFNTYVDNFSFWADPLNPMVGIDEQDGAGLKGDYEFMILDISADGNSIEVKGKKRGTRILMYKSSVPQSQWETYLKERLSIQNEFIFAGSPKYHMHVGDSTYVLSNAYTGVFNLVSITAPIDAVPEEVPFVLTEDGLRFSKFFEFGRHSFIQMYFNENKTAMIEPNNSVVNIVPESVGAYLPTTTSEYYATRDNLGGTFATVFDKFKNECATAWAVAPALADIVSIGFKYEKNQLYFLVKSANGAKAQFEVPSELVVENNTITVLPFDVNNMTFANGNANSFYFGNSKLPIIHSTKDLLSAIQGKFTLSAPNIWTINTISFEKDGNASDFIKGTR